MNNFSSDDDPYEVSNPETILKYLEEEYYRVNGFEVYKIYLAIKLHFTSKRQSYDFHRHNGKQLQDWKTFTKRRDRYFFHKDLVNLITITLLLITSLAILLLILIYGLATSLAKLAMIIINNGQKR